MGQTLNRPKLSNAEILKIPSGSLWLSDIDIYKESQSATKLDAQEIQKYAGIAPVTERSGQKEWIHWWYSCTTFLRQTFVEWAVLSVRYSFWAKAYYQLQTAKGKPHNTIIRALVFKWIRIVFRCWKTSAPYDESKYIEALKSKGSPLLKYAVES